MPHLCARGLNEGWTLRDGAHLHRQAVAAFAGCAPGALRDVTEARAIPVIVSVRIAGAVGVPNEDMRVRVDLVQAPSPCDGWHSRSPVRALEGSRRAPLSMNLVSDFMCRGGPSNTQLASAKMPAFFDLAPRADRPCAASILRARSRSMRISAPPASAPLISLAVLAEFDLDGPGLLCFASFRRFFAAAEEAATPGAWRSPAISERETHWYGNVDPGDVLDLDRDLFVPRGSARHATRAFVTARRASDGVLLATCEVARNANGG